ncbi:hypothetical protein CDAR_518741 [Caerostris darwini]|uniref:Uncharacterized protein n=1 Tax=Caerostris darwini TaxID=1538125 RepID=A0AAV4PNL1_9ARAC|nr:hypothetical protein CDAR_518741 [Caerostris darwini]
MYSKEFSQSEKEKKSLLLSLSKSTKEARKLHKKSLSCMRIRVDVLHIRREKSFRHKKSDISIVISQNEKKTGCLNFYFSQLYFERHAHFIDRYYWLLAKEASDTVADTSGFIIWFQFLTF